MTPEEYQQQINFLKERYRRLKLTPNQAEKVLRFEEDRDNHSQKFCLSDWEEWGHELSSFRRILNPSQMVIYERDHKKRIKEHESRFAKEDKAQTKDIKYIEESLKYHEQQFLPKLSKDSTPLIINLALSSDQPKIDYIKAEYKKFLNDSKKELLIHHFRFYRTLKPNTLKGSLLRHKISYLWPDYFSFKFSMDEPTKSVANYIKTKLILMSKQIDPAFINHFNQLEEFNAANLKKYYGGRETKGWHVYIDPLSTEEKIENRLMSLILLDPKKYGC